MNTFIVNGHGTKFRVTSKSGKSHFGLITDKGVKNVEVKDDLQIEFTEEKTDPSSSQQNSDPN